MIIIISLDFYGPNFLGGYPPSKRTPPMWALEMLK